MYLRCLTGDRPRQWVQWLPWVEFCYNSAFQISLKTSPFHVVYGRDPPTVLPYQQGAVRVPAMDQQLTDRDEFLVEIRDRLEQAQQVYRHFYNKKHRELVFSVGDWVSLRLIHRPVASMDVKGRSKLGPKFYGPFRVHDQVGEVAYKLELPEGAQLHNVFHVGLLKPHKGEATQSPGVLPPAKHERAIPQPAEVIKARLARGVQELLVHWDGQNATDATWVELAAFKKEF
jgi:hypothetical protein